MSLTQVQATGFHLLEQNAAFYLQTVPPLDSQVYHLLGALVPTIYMILRIVSFVNVFLYLFVYGLPSSQSSYSATNFETHAATLLNERVNKLASSSYLSDTWSFVEEVIALVFAYAALISYRFFDIGFAKYDQMTALFFLNLYSSGVLVDSIVKKDTLQKIVFAMATIKLISALGCFASLIQYYLWMNQGYGISTSILYSAILVNIFKYFIPTFFIQAFPTLATAAYYIYL